MKRACAFVLLFPFGLLSCISVNAFPMEAPQDTLTTPNQTSSSDAALTEYPVFIEETQQQTTTSTESEIVTESYMVVEEQEVDDDDEGDESDSSTVSSAIVKTTEPMQPPKSSPTQEEVLRELKKLWDYSEGLTDTQDNSLKTSLSSIVHLAYARIYSESEDTLARLKYLLQKLQDKLLVTESNAVENFSTTSTASELNDSTIGSLTDLMTATTASSNETGRRRRKRSYYDGYEDIESIFFANNNANSDENSLIPADDKHYYHLQNESSNGSNGTNNYTDDSMSTISNVTEKDPLDRSLLSLSSVSSTIISVSTTTPSTVVHKVIHINDRQKPPSSFYLSPERIKELKSRMTSTTTTSRPSSLKTSTLPPISIIIDDELENEVNTLQQQQHVDNYDVHISVTTPTPLEKVSTTTSTNFEDETTTDISYTAEEIALALFQLLRPDAESDDDESVTSPRPSPSQILYEVGSISSVYNAVKSKNQNKTTTPTPSTLSDLEQKLNTTWLMHPPPALSNLGYTSTSTERQNFLYNITDDLQAVSDQASLLSDTSSLSPSNIINGTKESISQMVQAITGLSNGAKMVLLFALSISVLSIGFGVYALGPPLVGVGLLGIIIPIGLLLVFETGAGKRKLTTRQKQLLLNKLNSEEFSQVVDLILDAITKYSKG